MIDNIINIDNIIIGSGPAGLQCGYFLKLNNIKYVILERNKMSGSFFSNFPLSGKLISINKKYTGKNDDEFNLRHDWNSLLNNEKMLFTNYSDNYYPYSSDYVNYLNDFSIKNNLNIKYEIYVNKIKKIKDKYYLYINDSNNIYICNKLIIATGLSSPIIPNIITKIKKPILNYSDFNKEYFTNMNNINKYKNKSILLIGGGNASYELANIFNEYCSSVRIIGRNKKKLAFATHYTGDIRSIYLQFFDTFLLKSRNAFEYLGNSKFIITQEKFDDKYILKEYYKDNINNINILGYFDHIIFCTGWKFDSSIFDFNIELTINNKYPLIKPNFESINNNNIFFIGSLMHSLDYKKTAGGFIHGFRYLIKQFVNSTFNINSTYKEFLFNNYNIDNIDKISIEITNYIINRINISSDIYQMPGTIGDILCFNNSLIRYYSNILLYDYENNIENIKDYSKLLIITLEFGKDLLKINEIGDKKSDLGSECNANYIHPVFKIYNYENKNKNFIISDIIHLDEEIISEFTNEFYYNKIYDIIFINSIKKNI